MVCSACGSELSSGARFCSACGKAVNMGYAPGETAPPVQTRLVRPRVGRAIAGVCASFALAYGWDVVVVRLVWCLIALCCAGAPVIVYLIAWLIIPSEQYPAPHARAWPTPPPNSPPDATIS